MRIEWLENVNFFSGLKVEMLAQNEFSKEIRITMPKNIQMKEHSAPAPIVVQVLKGKISFCVSQSSEEYEVGDMILLESNVPHSLYALEDSVVRLTLSKKDSVERAKKVPIGVFRA